MTSWLHVLMDERIPAATRLKRRWAAALFETWRKQRNDAIMKEEAETENLSPIAPTLLDMTTDELNYSMARFLQEVRKKMDQGD